MAWSRGMPLTNVTNGMSRIEYQYSFLKYVTFHLRLSQSRGMPLTNVTKGISHIEDHYSFLNTWHSACKCQQSRGAPITNVMYECANISIPTKNYFFPYVCCIPVWGEASTAASWRAATILRTTLSATCARRWHKFIYREKEREREREREKYEYLFTC